MSDEPESISVEEFRRLYGKQKKIRVPRTPRQAARWVCAGCGKRLTQSESSYFRVEGRKAIPYHFDCWDQENPHERQQD